MPVATLSNQSTLHLLRSAKTWPSLFACHKLTRARRTWPLSARENSRLPRLLRAQILPHRQPTCIWAAHRPLRACRRIGRPSTRAQKIPIITGTSRPRKRAGLSRRRVLLPYHLSPPMSIQPVYLLAGRPSGRNRALFGTGAAIPAKQPGTSLKFEQFVHVQ